MRIVLQTDRAAFDMKSSLKNSKIVNQGLPNVLWVPKYNEQKEYFNDRKIRRKCIAIVLKKVKKWAILENWKIGEICQH